MHRRHRRRLIGKQWKGKNWEKKKTSHRQCIVYGQEVRNFPGHDNREKGIWFFFFAFIFWRKNVNWYFRSFWQFIGFCCIEWNLSEGSISNKLRKLRYWRNVFFSFQSHPFSICCLQKRKLLNSLLLLLFYLSDRICKIKNNLFECDLGKFNQLLTNLHSTWHWIEST